MEIFRRKRFGRLFLQCLAENASESKAEKEKNQFKAAMWNKVNGWLTEIDNRPGGDAKDARGEETKGGGCWLVLSPVLMRR